MESSKKSDTKTPELTEEQIGIINKMRDSFMVKMGQIVMSLMGVPRYSHQPIKDLQTLCLVPLMRNRIAIATAPKKEDAPETSLAAPLMGIAIWASVSEEVDVNIREQVKAGIFPIKMKPEDWTSGEIVWLLDVIAPSKEIGANVIANFNQVLKQQKLGENTGQIRLHPVIKRLIGDEALSKLRARPMTSSGASSGETRKPSAKKPKKAKPAKTGPKKVKTTIKKPAARKSGAAKTKKKTRTVN